MSPNNPPRLLPDLVVGFTSSSARRSFFYFYERVSTIGPKKRKGKKRKDVVMRGRMFLEKELGPDGAGQKCSS